MGTYAVLSLAGSVGKTTTATSLAVLLAQQGARVRLIDIDAQANSSSWVGYPGATGITTAHVLTGAASIAEAERPARYKIGGTPEDPEYAPIPGLTVVPSNRSTLDKVMVELTAHPKKLRSLSKALGDAEPADVTILDGPGSFNAVVVAGFFAAAAPTGASAEDPSQGIITCTKPSGKENEGVPDLLDQLDDFTETYSRTASLLAIVPCAVPSSGGMYPEQLADLVEDYAGLIAPTIHRRSIVDEAYTNFRPVPLYGYRAKDVTDEYRAVLTHLQARGMFLHPYTPAVHTAPAEATTAP